MYPSPADGHLGCFHLMATMNHAAVNMGGQVSVFNSFGRIRGRGSHW